MVYLKFNSISMPNNIDIFGVRLDTANNVDTGGGGIWGTMTFEKSRPFW